MAKTATAKKAEAPLVGDLAPWSEDVTVTSTEGTTIISFLRGLVPFFMKATAIEKAARETLVLAKAMTRPMSMDADESMQRFLKTVGADIKAAEAHWEITAIVSRFHRRLTAARKRATDPLEEAKAIGNGHHNAYVETENRRVAIEQERTRREAETQARIDRERELAAQEEQALDHELELENCSERERAFVDFYVLTIYASAGNAAESARRAQYKNPDQVAARLFATPKIVVLATAFQKVRSCVTRSTKLSSPTKVWTLCGPIVWTLL